MGSRRMTHLALAASMAIAGCSSSADRQLTDLAGATAENEAMFDVPICDVVPEDVLDDLGAVDPGVPAANPIWAGCTWERTEGGSLELRTGTFTDIDRTLFEAGEHERPHALSSPALARAAIIDDHPATGTCASLLLSIADDGGFVEIALCGDDARQVIRTNGVTIARATLDALA